MSYPVLLHPKVVEFLESLDSSSKKKIMARLKELENNPETKGERLKHSPFSRLRIGDYRAIYIIDEEEKKVIVPFIGHRRDVYDDFSRLL